MNNITLIGNLTKNAENRMINDGETNVIKFSLAVQRDFQKDKADFFTVVYFTKSEKMLSLCQDKLKKGFKVAVSGRLQNNNYETQSGEKRYTTEIIADKVEFLEPKGQVKQATDSSGNEIKGFQALEDDDEIPF